MRSATNAPLTCRNALSRLGCEQLTDVGSISQDNFQARLREVQGAASAATAEAAAAEAAVGALDSLAGLHALGEALASIQALPTRATKVILR